jgi:hypothetical protein
MACARIAAYRFCACHVAPTRDNLAIAKSTPQAAARGMRHNLKGQLVINVPSGKFWVRWADVYAQNSDKIADLQTTFRKNLEAFQKALEDAGATVKIESTRRSKMRAYLFHWSWKIYLGKCRPKDARKMDGVDIQWDHHDLAKSKAGAKEMVLGFDLAVPPNSKVAPSLSSNHITGKAVDMTITWSGKIQVKKKNGQLVEIAYTPNPNNNKRLRDVGASYGVKKHTRDKPHWSVDGK